MLFHCLESLIDGRQEGRRTSLYGMVLSEPWEDLALQKGLEASAREKANPTTQRIPPSPTHTLQRRNLSLGLHQACCFVYATIDLPSQFAESRHLGALLCHFDKSCEAHSHSLSGAAFANGAPVTGPLEFSSESLEVRWGGQH